MNTFWNDFFSNTVVVSAIIAVLGAALSYLGNMLRQLLNNKLGKDKLDKAIVYVEQVVGFVEQISNQMGWNSQEKFNEAFTRIRAWAAKNGITYTDEEWRVLVEKAVFELTNAWDLFKECEDEVPTEKEGSTP